MSYSASHDVNSNHAGPPSGGGYGGSGMNIAAIMRSFRRQIPLMMIIFLILAATGWYMGSKMKRTYAAEARMMVTISDEYIFTPIDGQNNGGLIMTPDSITLNEIAIMNNPELIEQVIAEIGYNRLFPTLSGKFARSSGLARDDIRNDMLKEFESSYAVAARPKSSIVDLRFEHESPQVAVDTLNTLIDAYQASRRSLFVDDASGIITERRIATEEQLSTVDRAISRFLRNNQIADFQSERDGVRKRTEDLRAELNKLRGSMREAEGALASTEDRLRATSPTIDLYVDDRASQRIAQAELERKQLMAKYLPTSDPVSAKEREIAELRQLVSAAGGAATGGRRVGPNTVYQALLTERNKHQALADSYREKEYVLQGQLNSADGKVAKLTSLDPEYQNLLREKKTLETHLSTLNAREQTALVDQQQAEVNSENVKVINRANLPRKGRNMKKIVQYLSVIGAAMTALMIGLLGVFIDPSIYGPVAQRAAPEPKTKKEKKRRRRKSDEQPAYVSPNVPEPVQPYMPQEAPAYAPAAYAPVAYEAQNYEQQTYADPYAQPAEYQQAYAATGTDGYAAPQAYDASAYPAYVDPANPYATAADPHQAYIATPYVADTAHNPYAQPHAAPAQQFVAGPNGEQIPVIGQG